MKVKAIILLLHRKINIVDQDPSVQSWIFYSISVVSLTPVAHITTLEYYKEDKYSPCAKMTYKFVKLPYFCIVNDFFLWVLMTHCIYISCHLTVL